MTSIDEFVSIVRDELGLPVTADDVDLSFDELPGWDSVQMLWLLTILEQRTGKSLSLPDMLEAPSLAGLHKLVVAAR
ncbi:MULTISPECIES: acyl carrier protein [Streptomyces]|jgi:acyl carrier protein|uniref:Acyl carrier protein n=1 Tax=Streptomyces doudnae TaxID=3075536 RepID=A0ABD5EL63_9ACTN|nr:MULTISPECIES: acyl carrier protein [unclassified Streptomyces]MDT0435422.1 acyl carrier protein [Streptomyces sp. DSM 41981]MYQ62368.1 acyl carrier protein [Streptomyces sp. SID4950]SCD36076.1 Acyl carrier protein [Streptomyces sp. SolWspMP-5a-2]